MGRMLGTVHHFDNAKGYGVIIGDDKNKYLFFYRDIIRKQKNAKPNERVLFKTVKDARGTRAIEVRFVGGK